MRITIFVTLFSISAFAQVGLNGQISTQSGFTRTQLEREVSPPNSSTTNNSSNGSNVIYVAGNTNGSCFKTACKMLEPFGCDEAVEISAVARVCKGQTSDECLVTSCKNLGEFACDDAREITKILVSNCGADETLRPSEQRVQDSGDRQTLNGF